MRTSKSYFSHLQLLAALQVGIKCGVHTKSPDRYCARFKESTDKQIELKPRKGTKDCCNVKLIE